MTPPHSKYGPLHALAAGAVLVYSILSSGLAAFWHYFLHGIDIQLTDQTILLLLGTQTAFFGGLLLILWITTLFLKHPHSDNGHPARCDQNWDNGRLARCARFTLLSALPICLIAFGLNWTCSELLSRLFNINLSDQPLVKVVTSNTLSATGKTILYSFLLLEAPLLEEPLFRGVIFGGLTKIMPVWVAMVLSGFLFALVHVNAATFIPLWFLGIAFAWLYVQTGTLLVPMAVHFIFNAVNLLFLL